MILSYVTEGSRILLSSWKRKAFGSKRYHGSEREILSQIVGECFLGSHFAVSRNNFNSFYIRDFGICIEDLMNLGYNAECRKTIAWALKNYIRDNRVTTTITNDGRTVDFFNYSIDSLAFLCKSLVILNDAKLTRLAVPLLKTESARIFENYLEKDTGLIKRGIHFSSIKDHGIRDSSCYDNAMIGMISDSLNTLSLDNPFSKYDHSKILIENFWEGRFFYEDINKRAVITGDANIFPFWCKIVKGKDYLKKAIKSIRKERLDVPFPLRYTRKENANNLNMMNALIPDYEGNTVWAHLGLCYIDIVESYDKNLADRYLKAYLKNVRKYKNFYEVYDPKGLPYSRPFYYSDEGLLWSAKLLNNIKANKKKMRK